MSNLNSETIAIIETKQKSLDLAASNQQNFFDTEHVRAGLKRNSVRSGVFSVTRQCSLLCLNVARTIVLARVLSPTDFGLVVMAGTLTGFGQVLTGVGLSTAIVQRDDITHRQVSTLFWINLAICIAITMLTILLAPVIAWFYSEPSLIWITSVLASTFFLQGLSMQHRSLLRRQMRFGALAVIDVTSCVFGSVVGIVLALCGAGYWALVIMLIVQATSGIVLTWLYCRWIPGRPVRGAGTKALLVFGGYVTGTRFLATLSINIDKIVLGRVLGAQVLGIYNNAYKIFTLPLSIFTGSLAPISESAMSRLSSSADQLCSYYRKCLGIVSFFGMASGAFIFVTADKIVLILLGEQWLAAIPILRILSIAIFVQVTTSVGSGSVFVALGNVRRQLVTTIIGTVLRTTCFILGIKWGAIGLAVAFTAFSCVWRIPVAIICFWKTPLKLRDLLSPIWRPAFISAVAGTVLFWADCYIFQDISLVARFALCAVTYATLYFLLYLGFPSGKAYLFSVVDLVRELKGNQKDGSCSNKKK